MFIKSADRADWIEPNWTELNSTVQHGPRTQQDTQWTPTQLPSPCPFQKWTPICACFIWLNIYAQWPPVVVCAQFDVCCSVWVAATAAVCVCVCIWNHSIWFTRQFIGQVRGAGPSHLAAALPLVVSKSGDPKINWLENNVTCIYWFMDEGSAREGNSQGAREV